MVRTGRCLCGRIRYEITGELPPLVNCHCQFCRRFHGAAFVTAAMVQSDAFHITAGRDALCKRSNREGSRHFCRECGSRMFNRPKSTDAFLMLIVATLDEGPETTPVMHLNTESMAPWYEILDSLPQFPGLPPEFDGSQES